MSQLSNSFKEDVRKWGFGSRAKMLANVKATAKREQGAGSLRTSLTTSVSADGEVPTAVRFKFPRHGVFYEKGVRRGVPITSTERKPHPWFNPVVEERLDDLASIAAQNMADIAVNRLMIK